MVYYSEELNKKFKTAEECEKAEKAYFETLEAAKKKKEEKSKEKKARANEVNDAFKDFKQAEKHYIELRNQFIKDYGCYHMTYSSSEDLNDFDFKSLIDEIFDFKRLF